MSKKLDAELVDDDNPEWTDEMFKGAVGFNALPESLQTRLRGRPKTESPKVATTIRFDADVLEAVKATGKGWQTRVNDAVRAWIKASSA